MSELSENRSFGLSEKAKETMWLQLMCCALPNFSSSQFTEGRIINRMLEEELRNRGSRESKSIFELLEYNVN